MSNPLSSATVFTLAEIKRNFESGTYARGVTYFEEGRVTDLRINTTRDRDQIEVIAQVRGGGQIYGQQIIIGRDIANALVIDGGCTCPVGFNCKHVVAACLAYQATHKSTPQTAKDACFSWLDEFSAMHNPSEPPREFVAYVLSPGKSAGVLQIQAYVTKFLKNGSLSKGRLIGIDHLTASYYASFPGVTPIDREIGNILKAMQREIWRVVWVEGDLGYIALTKIAHTGRGYLGDIRGAQLHVGAARALQLNWKKDHDGNAKLHLDVADGAEVLLTDPPLYLDPKSGCIGLLEDAPYTSAQLKKLLGAPVVPAKLVPEFSQRLVRHHIATPLPPPQSVPIEEVLGCTPVPCLFLNMREREGHQFHLVRLRYRYQGHEICALPLTTLSVISEVDKTVRVTRDLQQEQAALTRMTEFGFKPLMDANQTDLVLMSFDQASPMEGLNRWQHFIAEGIPALREEGWNIEFDAGFKLQFHTAAAWDAEIEEDRGYGWFDLRFDVKINGRVVALLPLITQVLAHFEPDQLPEMLPLQWGDNEYISVPRSLVKPVLDILYELYSGDFTLKDGALRLSRFDAARLAQLDDDVATRLHWRGGDALRVLGRKLKDFRGIIEVRPPVGLQATLRPYQQQGLNWLQFLREYAFGGVLADDMGLGKTVQTLSHLLLEKEQGRMLKPCLIIAPTSLMSNWRREAAQFAPHLSVLTLQGAERHRQFSKIKEYDIVLSTYPLLSRDEDVLLAHEYHVLVLDEAQVVKNSRAISAQVARHIKAEQKLCLTGTPMENHLGELWALFDFLMPGFLGSQSQFTRAFRTPIEKHGNAEIRQRLARRIAPFMLRRTKSEVARELPEKTEIIRSVRFDVKQAALYESIRIAMEKKVRDAIAHKGLARSQITILDALLKLRQVCCDPRLLPLQYAKTVQESAKLDLLMQMLPALIEEGRRVLVFSQFTSMLELIEQALVDANIQFTKLTGQTRDRDQAIERFKSGAVPVFLISLKAGGVGLNLTEADTVIHYDPWWNPATENQATDRAHRIGQHKAVFVYKLVTENSVEEKILIMQAKKYALAQGVYRRAVPGEEDEGFSAEDLQQLFAPVDK